MRITIKISVGFALLAQLIFKSGLLFAQDPELLKKLEQYPDSLELHQEFIEQAKSNMDTLISQYEKLREKFPASPTIPYTLGKALFYRSHPEARRWLEYALEADSNQAEVYMLYGIDAGRWGDYQLGTVYLAKASEMEPENPDYAFYEANSYGMYDQATYTEKMNAVTRDFAGDGTAAKALYWLADKETDTLKKIAYYRELSERYPIGEFSFARSGMSDYFDVLVDSDLEAAEALAKRIWEQHADSAWLPRLRGAQKLLRSEGLLKSGRTDEAIDSLSVAVASSISAISRRAVLLKADAFASQGEQRRSMDVLKMFFLANPDIVVYEKTESLGVSVGMDRQQVKDFIKSALLKEAPAATDLRGTSYIDHQPIKLSDFRGKTILLTFWFPTCGPCHAEFPHFEAVLQKMKGQHEIAYIGVNIVHDQDDYVMPFIKKGSTSFIPMKDSPDERGNLIAEAAPTNYLIDKDGRIVFRDFLINDKNRGLLELMIWLVG